MEETDRNLSDEEAMRISGLTEKEYREVFDTIAKIDLLIAERAKKAGLIHVDGKKEFAYDEQRRLMIVDTFGTLTRTVGGTWSSTRRATVSNSRKRWSANTIVRRAITKRCTRPGRSIGRSRTSPLCPTTSVTGSASST